MTLDSATASGVSLSYQYDELNRLKKVTDNRLTGSKDTLYTYDAVGNLQTLTYPNAVTNLYSYDALNRLTNLVWAKAGTVKAGFGYTLGATGNRLTLAETNNGSVRNYTWGYDNGYRLTSEQIATTAPTGTLSYGLDDVGNRTSRTGTLGALGAQTFNYDQRDQLDNDAVPTTASTYFDANGNTTSYGGTYTYDWANRLLTQASPAVTLTYDADGNRIKKVAGGVTTWYLVATVNPGGYPQVVEELTGATPSALSKVYGHGLDLIDQRVISPAGTNFYGYDGLGSVKFLTDTSGAITDTYTYDAYGNLIASLVPTSNNYRFAGEQWDPELGFYYLRARYLNPGIGRFQNADSFQGNRSDPISLHRYLYVSDDPANRTDPSGHFSLSEQLAATPIWAKIGAIGAGATVAALHVFNRFFNGDLIDPTQQSKVNTAIQLMEVNGFKEYSDRIRQLQIRTRDKLIEQHGEYGNAPFFAFRTIITDRDSFKFDDRIFASILLHEAVHSKQYFTRNRFGEPEAYQVQSDFLRAVGVTGTPGTLDARFPNEHDVFVDLADRMEEYGVVKPAIQR